MKADIRDFWEKSVCGSKFVNKTWASKEFFIEYSKFRYKTEWHLEHLVPFSQSRGKKILEIGCGMGSDGKRFAESGAEYYGCDLTEAAAITCKTHLNLFGFNANITRQNAEELGFVDSTFDYLYSHGVLHHTDDMSAAISEIFRVLKPNREILVMLYNKNSLNYYLRIMVILRISLLLYIAFRPIIPKELRTNDIEEHYKNFLKHGYGYFRPSIFLNHCTDGVQCPIARAYTKNEVKSLFRNFADIKLRIAHLPIRKHCRFIPLFIERWLAKYLGWYLFIYGTKPSVK
ncbi:MAG: class I SAM-dependent methyltransferase [bacterium]